MQPDSAPALDKKSLYQRLDTIRLSDVARFRRRIKNSRTDRAREAIARDLDKATAHVAAIDGEIPTIEYPKDLPVSGRIDDIAAALRDNQVVIVAGETGSGKTTQIPKMCLEAGYGRRGYIGHTQPRRLAARTVAERIAAELDQEIGTSVGYAIRYDDNVGPHTAVKLMTDGILLAEMQRDRMLRAYDVIIIDEAHERSLNIDFLLGYLRRLLPKRPDLRVIITSATIDPERFAAHFADANDKPAPIIEVSGRTYPVEIRYRPLLVENETKTGAIKQIEIDPVDGLCDAIDELMREGDGDILCFFSGEREIRDAAEAIEARKYRNLDTVMLFGRLSNAEQRRAFQPHGGRRVVLATNIAETSLTVPGIRYVIDTGTARISRYSHRTKVQRLPIEPISQASANQRSGRCGRVADGIAIRLYSEEDFNSRDEYTDPEILRTNLASVILNMAALHLGDIHDFPFINPPDTRSVRDGLLVLHELGALKNGADATDPVLTPVGQTLSRIPLDPRLARMLVAAHAEGCLEVVSVIVAGMTIQDIRQRPLEQEEKARQLHSRFDDPTSDMLTYVNIWAYLFAQRDALSGNAFRRLCHDEFFHYLRTREWADLVRQLKSIAQQIGWQWNTERIRPLAIGSVGSALGDRVQEDGNARRQRNDHGKNDNHGKGDKGNAKSGKGGDKAPLPKVQVGLKETFDPDSVHRSMLTGLLSHCGVRDEQTKEYIGARNSHFVIFPGSSLPRKGPQWIMAGELVQTSRLFARDVATIKPKWLETIGAELMKYSYSDPYWSSKQASAMVKQRGTLYGLPVIIDRPVKLQRINEHEARQLFIRHALVEGDWTTEHKFYHDNQQKLEEAAAMEEKARRRDIVIDDELLVDFYDRRLPADVTSGQTFDKWWRRARKEDATLLDFDPQKLLAGDTDDVSEVDFPDLWRVGAVDLELSYVFSPGDPHDGVSVRIPLPLLTGMDTANFDWLVPGLRHELVIALMRSLPKALRTNVVPVPEFADRAMKSMTAYEGRLVDQLADALRQLGGAGISAESFNPDALPAHLRMNFQAIDKHGKVVDSDRDLRALQQRQAEQSHNAMSAALARGGFTGSLDSSESDGGGKHGAKSASGGNKRGGGKQRHDKGGGTTTSTSGRKPQQGKSGGNQGAPGAGRLGSEPQLYSTWTDDTLGTIPESLTATVDGIETTAYPAIALRDGKFCVQVFPTEAASRAAMLQSFVVMAMREININSNRTIKGLPLQDRVAVENYPHGGTEGLISDAKAAVIRDFCIAKAGDIRTPKEFDQFVKDNTTSITSEVRRVVVGMAPPIRAYINTRQELKQWAGPAIDDMNAQLDELMPQGAVARYGLSRLQHVPRYMEAIDQRLETMELDPDRDADRQEIVERVNKALATRLDQLQRGRAASSAVKDIRFQIQELRVSLFAERLGTAQRVSEQRILKAIKNLR